MPINTMINQTNTNDISRAPNAVAKILPVLNVQKIGSADQDHASKARQFNIGQVYQAKVLDQVDSDTHLVEVDSTLLKMQLGDSGKTGQTLPLRFMQLHPVPTFALELKDSEPQAVLSRTGKLIATILSAAKAEGAQTQLKAEGVVSQQPSHPTTLAHDLKQAISKTGLFYESHLTDFARGQRTLESLRQEPQNVNQNHLATLVSQQLNVLETHKLSWQGEIWPGQQMAMEMAQLPNPPVEEKRQDQQQTSEADAQSIQAALNLTLPTLGEVKAKLSIVHGKLTIQLAAKNTQTHDLLNAKKSILVASLEAGGQQIDALSVKQLAEVNTKDDVPFRPVRAHV